MRIAVIGSGISGMVASYLLAPENDLTLFEANDYIGGHSNTVQVSRPHGHFGIDTGFITYNERNYPLFTKLLKQLGVASQATTMSFSVRCDRSGWEYNGETWRGLFAQPANLLRPSFLGMLRDILRFNREALDALHETGDGPTIGDFLDQGKYRKPFIDRYLLPMASAIWSTDLHSIRQFPTKYFVRFFHNHGLLTVKDQPVWRTIVGGSREYVAKLTHAFRDRIRLRCPIQYVRREAEGVVVKPLGREEMQFDKVVIAVHADQALRMLSDPSGDEKRILQSFEYQKNDTLLHHQSDILPRNRHAWASWNYHVPADTSSRCTVTYNMNKLHQFKNSPETFCVTLNRSKLVRDENVLGRFEYEHPVYSGRAFEAQSEFSRINAHRNTYYCGAYWGYGFHEDGVRSATAVAELFGRRL